MDSLVEADADSALRLMGQTQSGGWSRRDAMRLELLRAKAMNRADSLFTTDSLMLSVVKYYQRHGSRNDRMLSLYLLGCTYRDMGAAPRAIETWQKAVAEADTTRQDCDLSTLMRIHSQMNGLYTRQRLPEYAQQEIEIAEALCWKMKGTLNALIFEEKKCNILFSKGEYEECIQASNALYQRYLQYGYREEAKVVSIFSLKSYLAIGEYAKAKPYLDLYESYCLSLSDSRKLNGGLAPYYINKGNYYLGIGKMDSAEDCFRKALPDKSKRNNALLIYKGLYQTYSQQCRLDSALKYMSLYSEAKERDFYNSAAQATINAKNLYDYSVEQKISIEEQEKATLRIRYIYALIFIIAILLCCAMFIWNRMLKKDFVLQQEKDKLQSITQDLQDSKKLLTALYEEKERIKKSEGDALERIADLDSEMKRLIDKHYSEEAKRKSAEQERKALDTQLSAERERVEKYREELKALQNRISEQEEEIIRYQEERNRSERVLAMIPSMQRAKSMAESEIMARFIAVRNGESRVPLTDTDWQDLEDTITSIYPRFTGQINVNSLLTDTDYKICLLVKAQFCPKDIDVLMGWSIGYSSTVRRRLLEVVFNIKGGAAEFDRKIGLLQ